MKKHNFNRVVSLVVSAAFLFSSLLPQNAFSAQKLSSDTNILNSIMRSVPNSAGYITEYDIKPGDNVLVYIQDLHCNPGVQKNISEIISSLDKNAGVDKVILEGAPKGKVEKNVLTALPENVKYSVVEKLLSRGLLTGAELYSVENGKNNIYGVEDWDKYVGNINRAANLLQRSDTALSNIAPFKKQVLKKTKKTLDILGDLASFKRDNNWYETLSQAQIKYSTPLHKYKNLSNYVNLRQLSEKINLNAVKKELELYVSELKNVLSYRDFNNLASKTDNRVEYYKELYACAEKNDFISFIERFPNLYLFLAYSIKSGDVNPISVFYDEETYVNKIINSQINNTAGFEDLLLLRMTSLLDSYLSLSMTDGEYDYFSGNKKFYKTLISAKYPEYEELVFSYLDNVEYDDYYSTNIDRNEVFFKNLSDAIKDGGKINVFVSGGFHTSLIKDFKENGISYVLITPAVKDDFNSIEVYNRLIEINSSVPLVLRNALTPIPMMLAVYPDVPERSRNAYLNELINSIINSSKDYRSPSALRSVIEEWGRNISEAAINDISVSFDDKLFKIKIQDQILEFKIKDGLIDFNEQGIFVPENQKYRPVKAALEAAGNKFSPFGTSIIDFVKYTVFRAVNKASFMSMKLSGNFHSRMSKRKEDGFYFRQMKLFYHLKMKGIAKAILASLAWKHSNQNPDNIQKMTFTLTAGKEEEQTEKQVTIVIEGGFDLTQEDLEEIIRNAQDVPGLKISQETLKRFPDTLYIGLLDKSATLFENYTGIGFIGVNKAINEIGKDLDIPSNANLSADDLRKIIFKMGVAHEIAHEFLGNVDRKKLKSFEDSRLMKDISYMINEIKKKLPFETLEKESLLKAQDDNAKSFGIQEYHHMIKEEYLRPYLANILDDNARFIKRVGGYKLTLDELIELLHGIDLVDEDIMHLGDTYFTSKEKSKNASMSKTELAERVNNEEYFYKNIVLKNKKKTSYQQAKAEGKVINKKKSDEIDKSKERLIKKLEGVLRSVKTDEAEIERITATFSNAVDSGLDALYRTLSDGMFKRFFENNTVIKEHGLPHSLDVLSYMLEILANDKSHLQELTDKNIKFMVYSALFHDLATIISRNNHEHNSALMAVELLKVYNDADLDEHDIKTIASICEGHKKVKDDSQERPEHSNYFARLLHDADGFSAVLELGRIYDVWVNMPDDIFFNKELTLEKRIDLLRTNNFADGDAINDLIRQGFYRKKHYFYLTEGAKTVIMLSQSKKDILNFIESKRKKIMTLQGGIYKDSDVNAMKKIASDVLDAVSPGLVPLDNKLKNKTSAFTFFAKFKMLVQIAKTFLGFREKAHFPRNIYMSDVHGGYGRLLDLLLNTLKYQGDSSEAESVIPERKKEQILDLISNGGINAVYVGGDLVDRGGGQLQTLDLIASIAKAGKLRYVIGNHDLWCAMNISGIHLPYYRAYKGIDADYEDDYGNVKDLLMAKIDADEKAKNTDLGGKYIPRTYATDKSEWASTLAKYMEYADSRQKEKWDAEYERMSALFEKTYGFKLHKDGKDVLNFPEGMFKKDESLRAWWGRILGRNVGITVYTGLRAADKMSINWWIDRKAELKNLQKEYAGDLQQSAAFSAAEKLINDIIEEQKQKMKEEIDEDKWMWRVIDAIMYRNYESVEWWALDWAFHKSWGGGKDGLIAQRNAEIERDFREENKIPQDAPLTEKQQKRLSRQLLNQSNYLADLKIQDIANFFKDNFFLYRRDEYGTYMMHSLLPVDEDGDVAIGKIVDGKIEKYDEKGKRIKGFYFDGTHYHGKTLMKGLDIMGKALREGEWENQLEALALINSLYADLTTEIKPAHIRERHMKIGFDRILSNMGRGIMRLTVGHNPISKTKRAGLHSVEFAGERDAKMVLSIDDEFSERYAKPMGKGTINIYQGDIGIVSSSYESGAEDARIVSETVVTKVQFLKSVLYDISKPVAEMAIAGFSFLDTTLYNICDYFKSRLFIRANVWNKNNSFLVNVIESNADEKNKQYSNINSLASKNMNIIGIELMETDKDITDKTVEEQIPESRNRLFDIEKLKIASGSDEFIEIPVSFMYKKVRVNRKTAADYIDVYVGFEAKKIIADKGLEFNDALKNKILYAATTAFIKEAQKKNNIFGKKIRPVSSKRKIILRTASAADFDAALTDEQRRAMDGVLVARDGGNLTNAPAAENMEKTFSDTLVSAFGGLVFSDIYTLQPPSMSSISELLSEESIKNTKATADMLAAA